MEKKSSCCCGALPAMWWWLLTLLGLPLLFLLMTGSRQGVVENDLATRSDAALKAAGMDWAKVNITGRGRDVQLQGMAPSEADRDQAAQLAGRIDGVRDVQNLLEVAPAALAVAEPAMPEANPPLQAPVAPTAPEMPVAPAVPEAPVASVAPAAPAVPEAPVAPANPAQSGSDQTQAEQVAASKPEPTAEEQAVQDCQQQLNDAMSGKTILFETNKSAIKRDSAALLDSLVGIVSSCKEVIAGRGIQVSGHTDNVGNDTYNQRLSQQRADAVKAYFIQKGVDAGLVKSVGFGESKPVASNDNEADRSKNRRITFDINPE